MRFFVLLRPSQPHPLGKYKMSSEPAFAFCDYAWIGAFCSSRTSVVVIAILMDFSLKYENASRKLQTYEIWPMAYGLSEGSRLDSLKEGRRREREMYDNTRRRGLSAINRCIPGIWCIMFQLNRVRIFWQITRNGTHRNCPGMSFFLKKASPELSS